MGMIANYQLINEKQLNLFKFNNEDDELFEKVEALNDGEEILLDIDKMWDVLHFVFTGVSASTSFEFNRVKNNPLSDAVVGSISIGDMEFTSYIEKTRIATIVSALESFDMEKALENFSMVECKKAELYPDIWDYKEETDEIKEDLMYYFHNMKNFYNKVLEEQGSVLITIC